MVKEQEQKTENDIDSSKDDHNTDGIEIEHQEDLSSVEKKEMKKMLILKKN